MLKHIWIVFKKELKDILRDRKTLFSSIVIPVLIIPVLMLIVGGSTQKMTQEMYEDITVALTKNSDTESARNFLNNLAAMDENIIVADPVDDPWQAINEKKVKLVIELEDGFEEKLKNYEPVKLKLIYDNSLTRSGGAVSSFEATIDRLNTALAVEKLNALGISPDILSLVRVERQNIARTKDSNQFLMMMLPLFIAILVAVGGIPAATDLVAGEKERMTLEPLLTTRPSRMSILVGKYLTINVFSFASVISTLTGMVIAYAVNPATLSLGRGNIGGFSAEPAALILSLFITLLMGMSFSGIQLAISTYARSFKECQTYLSLLVFAVMIPAYSTMFTMPNDIQPYMFVIPVMNTISAFKLILGGITNYTGLAMATVSSVVYVIISLYLAAWMFRKEQFMFRS